MKRRSTFSKDLIIQKVHGISHHQVILRLKTCQGEEEVEILPDFVVEDCYEDLEAGDTLQIIANEFLDLYSEFPLLKYGNGDKDEERDNAVEATELECLHNYNNILDEVINHIMTKLSGDNENLVYNEAFENKIDDLVF